MKSSVGVCVCVCVRIHISVCFSCVSADACFWWVQTAVALNVWLCVCVAVCVCVCGCVYVCGCVCMCVCGPKHTKRVFKNGTLVNALFPMVRREIGRASCRERVEISVVAV